MTLDLGDLSALRRGSEPDLPPSFSSPIAAPPFERDATIFTALSSSYSSMLFRLPSRLDVKHFMQK
jgi:hypothetical protein